MCIKHGVFQSRCSKRVTRCPAQAFNFNKKQPIMRTEDRLFDRGWVRSAMATRKCGNTYFPKYFMAVRPSFMGIVFGVYRNWIWEFGDLRSYTPILWGSIWPNTIISNPIFYFFPRLHRIWDPNTMDSR